MNPSEYDGIENDWAKAMERIPGHNYVPCLLCGSETDVVVNIKFKARPVCDSCCLTITKQTVQAWAAFNADGSRR